MKVKQRDDQLVQQRLSEETSHQVNPLFSINLTHVPNLSFKIFLISFFILKFINDKNSKFFETLFRNLLYYLEIGAMLIWTSRNQDISNQIFKCLSVRVVCL